MKTDKQKRKEDLESRLDKIISRSEAQKKILKKMLNQLNDPGTKTVDDSPAKIKK